MFAVVQIANSQTATIQTKDGTYGTTQLNVSFSGFSAPVGAVTMKIGYNPNVATFTGITHETITSGIIANAVGNEIVIAWSNVPGTSVNGVGFKLNFIYSGGSCDLTFNQGCEIADGSGNVIQATLLNGAINQPSLSTTATIGSQNGDYSIVNELPVSFSGFPTTPADALVGAISLNIAYDNTKLQFVGINGLTGAIANAANGIITIQWSNATPININTLNLKLKFNYLGGYSGVGFSGVNIISNSNGVQIPVSMVNGSINQPITTSYIDIEDVTPISVGSTIAVPMFFSDGFASFGAFTFNIAYDQNVLTFIPNVYPGLVVDNSTNGILTFTGSFVSGIPVPPGGGYIMLYFVYNGGSTTINFTGQNEVASTAGAIIPVTFTGGNVHQPPTPVNVSLGNVSFTTNPVLVPLEFSGVTGNINSTTMFVGFDQTKLTFIGAANLSKSGIIVNQDYSSGKILINWADANAANTITNGKFLDLKFTFTGGVGNTNVPVYFTTFNSSSNSLSDDLGNTVLANFTNGNVNYVPPITTFNVTGGGNYCAGGTGKAISLDGSQTGVSYQLKLNGSNTGGSVAGTGNAISFGLQTSAGTYTVDATMGSSTIAMAGSATISINSLPTVSTASVTPSSVCGLGSVAFSATASEGSIVWYDALTGGNVVTPPTTISTTTTLYAEALSTQSCISAARTVVIATVNIVPTVSIASVTPSSVCGSGNVAFSATASEGSIVWYDALTGGNVVTPPTTISTTTTLYAEALSTQSCISAARTQVVAIAYIRPTASISGDATINNGNSATLTLTVTGTGPFSGLLNGSIPFSGPSSPITVSVSPNISTIYTISSLSDEHCTASVVDLSGSANIVVKYSISGILKYANATGAARPITNSTVSVKSGAIVVATTTTDGSGNFTLIGVPPGTYTYEVTTTKPWGSSGVTLADYTIVKNFVSLNNPILTGIYLLAADVNSSSTVTLADYTIIKNRVNTSSISGWSGSNWIFSSPTNVIITNNNIGGIVILGIVRGDVNASYTPPL